MENLDNETLEQFQSDMNEIVAKYQKQIGGVTATLQLIGHMAHKLIRYTFDDKESFTSYMLDSALLINDKHPIINNGE